MIMLTIYAWLRNMSSSRHCILFSGLPKNDPFVDTLALLLGNHESSKGRKHENQASSEPSSLIGLRLALYPFSCFRDEFLSRGHHNPITMLLSFARQMAPHVGMAVVLPYQQGFTGHANRNKYSYSNPVRHDFCQPQEVVTCRFPISSRLAVLMPRAQEACWNRFSQIPPLDAVESKQLSCRTGLPLLLVKPIRHKHFHPQHQCHDQNQRRKKLSADPAHADVAVDLIAGAG
jgi:hypothetical protein